MKAFNPVDVYPCTVDEEFINLDLNIASLFGHLCFGSTLTHDQEMELLASQRKIPKNTNFRGFQAVTSLKKGSFQQKDTISASFLGSPTGCDSHHALDEIEREPKRHRSHLSLLPNLEDDLSTSSLRDERIPRSKLSEFKQSLKSYLKQSKHEIISSATISAELLSSCGTDLTRLSRHTKIGSQAPSATSRREDDQIANQTEHLADRQTDRYHGTQFTSIELSDANRIDQGKVAIESQLKETPEPDDKPSTLMEIQFISGTQTTLSDAAFESQSQHELNRNIEKRQVQQRIEAYKAAKDTKSIWRNDYGLISSCAHHGEEEVEL